MSQIYAILAAAAVFVVAVAAQAAELRDASTIDRDVVVLGDLVEGLTADQAAIAVARAPEPGRTAEVPGTWVARVARAYGVDVPLASENAVSRITRASNQVDFSGIRALLIGQLRPQLGPGEVVVDMPGIDRVIHLPTSVAPTVGLTEVRLEPTTGQFSATVVAPADADPADQVRIPIYGTARAMVEVPVLARALELEEQIGTNDIAWVTMDSAHVPTGVARTTAELTGMAVRRALPAGDMVLVSDLEPPVVVARGSGVMITYTSGPLTILMRGRALEDGALGSVVRVANADSGRTVDAVVSGPGAVEANATAFIIN
ncbi:MAG: flagellar basal body P-ring formation protein FlgA [Rhodospirillaceae bacterium]|nr:flagellar basal body P-ring formation protein FlgA [Rhodospirillaceae bacterium]